MKIVRQTHRVHLRLILGSFALFCALLESALAQSGPAQSGSAPLQTTSAQSPAQIRGVISLDGPWKFQTGDDPRWADPGLDDSKWLSVTLSDRLDYQGIEPYTGYGWYRLRLPPDQIAALGGSSGTQLELLFFGDSVGQLSAYVNGVESGRTKGMTDPPRMFRSQPFAVQLSAPDATGARVIAIRTWAGPGVTVSRGLLTAVKLGTQPEISDRLDLAEGRQWDQNAIAPIVLAFLFLGVALLGAALYLSQRHHSEYLWLAILSVTATAGRLLNAFFGLSLLTLSAYRIASPFVGYIFMAVTIEFVFRFTGSSARRTVRGLEIAALLVPFFQFVPAELLNQVISACAELTFSAVVTVLLFQAWRKGRGDAGVMLAPFFLAASADWINSVLGFAAGRHWIGEQYASPLFHIGPIAYTVGNITDAIFLSSLIAVILYRFIRVSQDEQRANAEISAARSVQALLIPTQLPSNKNFMLESAYLPVHGVGGDFFQVLPLKDDSLLIVVGDVSGKGLQAAMSSSTLVGALRNEISHDPATVLDHLNHVLLGAVSTPGALPGLDSAPCFATCLCARMHPDGTLQIANAGHLSPYRDGRELGLPPSLPLGVIADNHYEQVTFHLKRGDRLVFLSDGVVEATSPDGELFGFERTQQVSNEPARYIAQTARRFGQTDDITVLSLYLSSRAAHQDSEEAVLSK
ncbi:MAG TPA: SpoIIE family protein phosphatase [Terracidiphilus sp.]|nr:SpoIIE family protein phosphatase [Terracidiphilus sp.]